jgi:hypothetical protein
MHNGEILPVCNLLLCVEVLNGMLLNLALQD